MEPKTGLRVLVVDDNRDAADSLAMLIDLQGHQSFLAYDAVMGLELAAEVEPHLILHDIAMPGMSGYEAVRRLRQNPQLEKALVVAISGYATATDKQEAKDAGFDAHYGKPMDFDVLLELLQTAGNRVARISNV